MRRGDVYTARLDPTEGSEQAGIRPVVIVSNNSINTRAAFAVVVPCTTYRGKRISPSQYLLKAGEANLTRDTVALCEQVRLLSKTRFERHWGELSQSAVAAIDHALRVALFLEP
jgi:mRNA interferase MazF